MRSFLEELDGYCEYLENTGRIAEATLAHRFYVRIAVAQAIADAVDTDLSRQLRNKLNMASRVLAMGDVGDNAANKLEEAIAMATHVLERLHQYKGESAHHAVEACEAQLDEAINYGLGNNDFVTKPRQKFSLF